MYRTRRRRGCCTPRSTMGLISLIPPMSMEMAGASDYRQSFERNKGDVFVGTKAGRRLQPHMADGYNHANLTAFVERSLKNLKRETLDLVQLHCPPTEVYYRPEVFAVLDELKKAGKILHYGVSVEKVEEAMKATEYPGVATVQSSSTYSGNGRKFVFPARATTRCWDSRSSTAFERPAVGENHPPDHVCPDDHRNFNRIGEQFDRGETFSGVDFDVALDAVEELDGWCPRGSRWPTSRCGGFWIMKRSVA